MLGLLASLAAREAKARAAAAARRAMLLALAGGLALIGTGFLLAAGFIATAQALGTLNAALAFGAGFLVLAGLVALIARKPHRRRRLEGGLELEALAALEQAPQAVAEGIAKSPGLALLGAFAGGLILALKLRK